MGPSVKLWSPQYDMAFLTVWGLRCLNGQWICGIEPFSGVEIHMEMDMEWKWMEMGHNL